ncbi:MAG: hypothetical protein K9W43_12260 [Candidatus Thorarchaeota archaeon]|nr:hypothetical protein [Candidatus Thorarchaeota archaeon]
MTAVPRGVKRDGSPKKRTWMMPQEVEVWYILPAIRRELARAMIEAGRRQKDIARMLGITEPAVSQYKLRKSETARSRGDTIEFPDDIIPYIKKAANNIMEAWDHRTSDAAVYEDMTREIIHLIKILRDAGIICEVHRQQAEHVSDDCHACMD